MIRTWIDQTGYKLEVQSPPQRIISLVPSQTELLFELGLEDQVVGITKFCIHPPSWFKNKQRVGGTKKINHSLIRSLQPDLILANKEENTLGDVLELRKHFPVYTSNIYSLDDAFGVIKQIGELVDRTSTAYALYQRLKQDYSILKLETASLNPPKALYLIWENPRMAAGTDTFINEMLQVAGFRNVISGRYPEVDDVLLRDLNPDVILLSSEPFPFKEKHIQHYQALLPHAKIGLVDGEYMGWYGSRMLPAVGYLRELKHKFE